ncbi:MAG: GNAT family N-acetyltransferase [Thermotogota bacterium]
MSSEANRFALRPAQLCDAAAIADLWNRRAALRGQPNIYTATDVEHRWSTPGFAVETDTQVAWNGTTLVGYGSLSDVKEPHVDLFLGLALDPTVEGNDGLTDTFFAWFEARAQKSLPRAPEGARVVFVAGTDADDRRREEVLVRHGFQLDRVWSNFRLEFERRPTAPEWPSGIAVRTFRPGKDDVNLVLAYRDAFRNHYGYLEQPLEAEVERWRHWITQPDFEPELWFLATAGEEICGYCCTFAESHGDRECGLVDEFGVRHAWRRRGIGRALLLEAFWAMYVRGLKAVELTAVSGNASGALDLYVSVGMTVVRRGSGFIKELRPGKNLVAS